LGSAAAALAKGLIKRVRARGPCSIGRGGSSGSRSERNGKSDVPRAAILPKSNVNPWMMKRRRGFALDDRIVVFFLWIVSGGCGRLTLHRDLGDARIGRVR